MCTGVKCIILAKKLIDLEVSNTMKVYFSGFQQSVQNLKEMATCKVSFSHFYCAILM
jgi:hypothetical protein